MARFIATVQIEVEAQDAWEAREQVASDVRCFVDYIKATIQTVESGSLPELLE